MRNRGWLWAAAAVLGAGWVTGLGRWSRPVAVAAAEDQKAAGAALYGKSGCAHCHGDDGAGTDRAPGLRGLRKSMKESAIHKQIVHGGQGMPAFGDALKPEDVDALVAFLRAKKWVSPPVVKAE